MLLMSEGIKARIMSKTSMATGSNNSMEGGGGSGGRTRGSINSDMVRQIRMRNDSMLK